MKFEVGKLFNEDKTRYTEGCRFNIIEGDAYLYIYRNNPSNEEIESCKKGNITFRFIKLDSVVFWLAKIGSMPIIDCPYSVHLSNHLTKINYPEENQGLPLTLFLINANNGILEAARFIGLGEKFSKEFINTLKEQGNQLFDIEQYSTDISNIYNKYSTKELEKMCRFYYKVGEK